MTSINKKHRGKEENNSNAAGTTPWPAFSRKKIGNFFPNKISELFSRKKIGNFFSEKTQKLYLSKIEIFFPKKIGKFFP
jgi:hypothetical protein